MSVTTVNQGVVPFLWYDRQAEEAMHFYTGIFPNSKINMIRKWGPGSPFPADSVMTGSITINGLTVYMFDAGPMFKFTEAISLFVRCRNQEEIDHYWYNLIAGGGNESMCGWLKDKFGLSWQIVPDFISEMSVGGDPKRTGQMFQALSQMKKLDIAELEKAYNA